MPARVAAAVMSSWRLTMSWVSDRYVSDRKSTRLNSSHQIISYAVFCLKKKKKNTNYSQKIILCAVIWLKQKSKNVANRKTSMILRRKTNDCLSEDRVWCSV